VASFDLGESLGIGIVVEDGELPVSFDEDGALLPTRECGDEVVRGGQFDVQFERALEFGQRAQEFVTLGSEGQVDVDRRRPPTVEYGRGAPDEVQVRALARSAAERG
jgi:hypothetical protein